MNFEATFTPKYIGNMMVRNRLVVPAMDSGMAERDGSIKKPIIEYYAARAKGGYGMVIVEIACVQKRGAGMPAEVDISSDITIPGLRTLADGIKLYGARAVIQLHHAGRETVAAMAGEQPVAPSSVPCCVNRETPHEMSTKEVYELIQDYIKAAIRAKKAGFDAVEIHAAHGYMGGQFLSPRSNKRIDEFGGSVESRAYFLKRIIEGIKQKCGKDYPVIVRISSKEDRISGVEENEAVIHAKLLEEYGADAIHISAGTYGKWDVIVPPPDYPPAWNIEATKKIKAALTIPVIAVGRYVDPFVIDGVIARGDTDFVATGRQSIADPDFPNKMFAGTLMEIIPCISCTQRCMSFNDPSTLQKDDAGVSCMLNPQSNARADVQLTPTDTPKKVMVVGAGPAGMEAAWIAASRGHQVCLYEKNARQRAGGQFLIGAYPPFKQELTRAIKFLLYMCEKHGVHMEFEKEVDAAFIEERAPDVLIIASGAEPFRPDLPGVNGYSVKLANDVLMGEPVSGNVLVIGGGMVGVETAEYCTDYCDSVTVVEMLPDIATDLYLTVRDSLLNRFKEEEVIVYTNTKVLEFTDDGIICERNGKKETLKGYDDIVIALGSKPCAFCEDTQNLATEVYKIGDAKSARSTVEAIYEAFRVAQKI